MIINNNVRILAVKEIEKILNGHKYQSFNSGDSFYKSLLSIAIRRLGEIQFYLNNYIKKPLKKEQNIIKANLIIGATQILYMRVPIYAAVNTSVDISKINSPHHVKFINAILRQLARDYENNKIKNLDSLINLPIEIRERWNKIISNDDLKKIAEQQLIIPPALDIAIKNKENIKEWCTILKGEIFGKNNVRIKDNYGKIDDLFGYAKGKWWIQDLAAQLPAKILISSVKKQSKIIDICAAPGGKTAQLVDHDLDVTAIESDFKRAKIMENNLKRLNLKTKIIIEDATKYKTKILADAILLDAPCSSTGTIRKNPDILWRLTAKKNNFFNSLNNLIILQKNLLYSAAKMLKPRGKLIYSVCSLETEEGENQIIDFIKDNSNFIISPIDKKEIDITKKAITKEGFIKTFPHFNQNHGGMDGFFIARLIKIN